MVGLSTPEGVVQGVWVTGFFLGAESSVSYHHKIHMPMLIILRKLPISSLRGILPDCSITSGPAVRFGSIFDIRIIMLSSIISQTFGSLRLVGGQKTTFGSHGWGLFF